MTTALVFLAIGLACKVVLLARLAFKYLRKWGVI